MVIVCYKTCLYCMFQLSCRYLQLAFVSFSSTLESAKLVTSGMTRHYFCALLVYCSKCSTSRKSNLIIQIRPVYACVNFIIVKRSKKNEVQKFENEV